MSTRREFCTLFDSNYLIKAVAMYRSLERNCSSFHLTAFCFDELAEALVSKLDFDHLSVVPLRQLEQHDHDLLSVKGDRTPVEYCWTATPALPRFLFETRRELDEVTYLDADLLFFSDPEPLFDELRDESVLITPHRFSPEYASEAENGIYNVQFLTFRRDSRGLEALEWWHDRCIEWCYHRLEDGKMGDQRYLDDWPERFPGIHVLQHKGGGLAPWNTSRYQVEKRNDGIFVDEQPLVFFHYHRIRLRRSGRHAWRPPGYYVQRSIKRLVYQPYMQALDQALTEIRVVDPGFERGLEPTPPLRERMRARRILIGEVALRRVPALSYLRYPLRAFVEDRGRTSGPA